MNRFLSALVITVASLATAMPAMAQQKRISPHETISQTFDGKRDNRVIIIYGRPYSKDPNTGAIRKIWGTLVPWGKVWRTGSDEATLLICQKPLVIQGTTIPAGAYTLFTIPNEDGTAKLVINKKIGQWGIPYIDAAEAPNEIAHLDLTKSNLDTTVDEFTMGLDKNPAGGGTLKMMWENTEYSLNFAIAPN